MIYQAIVFLPLIGALAAGLAGTRLFRALGSDAGVYGGRHGAGDVPHAEHDAHHGGPAWPMYLSTALLCVSAVLSWVVFVGFLNEPHSEKIELLRWVTSGTLTANWTLRIDTLTAVMLVVATDACGNESPAVVAGTIHVPHDQSPAARDCLDTTKVGCRELPCRD